jgi:hypothetical protein
MYPHVTQFETRKLAWERELEMLDARRERRSRRNPGARLPLVSRLSRPRDRAAARGA